MKYISECDLIVYDLHSGNPADVKMALEAFNAIKEEDGGDEKVLILISSLLAWDETPKKLQEIREKTPEELAAEKKAAEGSDAEADEEIKEEAS